MLHSWQFTLRTCNKILIKTSLYSTNFHWAANSIEKSERTKWVEAEMNFKVAENDLKMMKSVDHSSAFIARSSRNEIFPVLSDCLSNQRRIEFRKMTVEATEINKRKQGKRRRS